MGCVRPSPNVWSDGDPPNPATTLDREAASTPLQSDTPFFSQGAASATWRGHVSQCVIPCTIAFTREQGASKVCLWQILAGDTAGEKYVAQKPPPRWGQSRHTKVGDKSESGQGDSPSSLPPGAAASAPPRRRRLGANPCKLRRRKRERSGQRNARQSQDPHRSPLDKCGPFGKHEAPSCG
jgi:hypothetical protein